MIRFCLVMFSIVCGINISAQNTVKNCMEIFSRQDTVNNPADKMLLWQDCVVDKDIPDINVKTIDGSKLKSKDLKGKISVINLWFIDCLPCIKELPALNRLVKEYAAKDVIFLSVTWEKKERIQNEFLQKYKLDFQIVAEALTLIEQFGKPGYPTTFVVDKDGKVKGGWLGGPIDASVDTEAYNRVKPILDKLLTSKSD